MIDKEREREGERGREDVYERINFNVSYKMWNFLLTDFFKIKMKDILRFESKVISTITFSAIKWSYPSSF